jgi:hypothetical protein
VRIQGKVGKYSTNPKQGDGSEEHEIALNQNIPEKSRKVRKMI